MINLILIRKVKVTDTSTNCIYVVVNSLVPSQFFSLFEKKNFTKKRSLFEFNCCSTFKTRVKTPILRNSLQQLEFGCTVLLDNNALTCLY